MLKSKTLCLLYFLLHSALLTYSQKAEISGNISLDSSWTHKVYLSRIADFTLMYTASDALIIAEAHIDTNGNFNLQFPCTKEESLYRLHFIKNDDPVSTLIIGSKDENNIFFIAKETDHIQLHEPKSEKIVHQGNITGNKATKELNYFFEIVHNDSLDRKLVNSILLKASEASSSELVSLLAINTTFGLNEVERKHAIKILKKIAKNNPYGIKIFKEYQSKSNLPLLIVVSAFLLVVIVFVIAIVYKKNKKIKTLNSLSQRELQIAKLLLASKTNKEVATELNVELSTVKTHINNIYSKLKIESRKGLLKYKNVINEDKEKL